MRRSNRPENAAHHHGRLLAVVLAVGSITGGLLIESTGAGASSGPKGSAKVGSKTYKFPNGSCLGNGSHVQTILFDKGNSFTVTGKLKHGKFTNAIAGLVENKTEIPIDPNSGTSSSKGGTLKGSGLTTTSKITVKWSC